VSETFNFSKMANFTPKQQEAWDSLFKYRFTLFGGSRGPGKSYWLRWASLGWLLYWSNHGYPGLVAGLFTETYSKLRDRQISKIVSEFPDWLGTLREGKTLGLGYYINKEYGGGVICLRNIDDTAKYKSAEFALIAIDELTEHAVDVFNIILGSLRWPNFPDTRFIAGSNPDGIGNEWTRNYFIDHIYPEEMRPYSDQFNFVRALPADNNHLDENYWMMLRGLPEDLRRAWLEGDWDVFKGLAFHNFNKAKHVVEPFEIPDYWTRTVGIDFGTDAPFCALWIARNPDNGRVVVYKELYKAGLTDRQQARLILDNSTDEELHIIRFADPSMWNSRGDESSTSAAKTYVDNGCIIIKGNNNRLNGKRAIDRLLMPMEDGQPGILFFNTCPNIINQMSHLMYDKNRTEDVDTHMDDHAYDALRYALSNVRDYMGHKKLPKIEKSPFAQLERI